MFNNLTKKASLLKQGIIAPEREPNNLSFNGNVSRYTRSQFLKSQNIMSSKQIRIEDSTINVLSILYPKSETRDTTEHAIRCFIALSNQANASLRGIFSKAELIGIVSSLNGTMFQPEHAIIKEMFIAHLEDAERYENISSTFKFGFSEMVAKAKTLSNLQCFFLQEQVSQFWQYESGEENSLEKFLSKFI